MFEITCQNFRSKLQKLGVILRYCPYQGLLPGPARTCVPLFFLFLSSGGWGKNKLATLVRIFIHVVCRFNDLTQLPSQPCWISYEAQNTTVSTPSVAPDIFIHASYMNTCTRSLIYHNRILTYLVYHTWYLRVNSGNTSATMMLASLALALSRWQS